MIDFTAVPFESVVRAYPKWLRCAYNYYYEEKFDDVMSDDLWTALAQYYYKHIDKFPFLNFVDFNGTTLGCGTDEKVLLNEIDKY